MLRKWVVLVFATLLMLSACTSKVYNQTESNAGDIKLKMSDLRKKSDNDAKTPPALVVKKGLYVDTSPISLEKEPSWLKNYIVLRGDQLPFSYYSRTIAKGAGNNTLTDYQPEVEQSTIVTMNYAGTVKGALDLLAAKSGYMYNVQGNSIHWQALITKTFDVAFMPGGTDYLMGKASGGSSASSSNQNSAGGGNVSNYTSSDTSESEFSSLKGSLSVWKDLGNSITQMLSDKGKMMLSESTTSVTVRDKPANLDNISRFIENLNHNLSRQVLVKVQILEVNLENDYNLGINWSILANAFHKSPFRLNANYGTPISITALSGGTTLPLGGVDQSVNPASNGGPGLIPSYTILFNALNQQGKTSVVSEPRVVCLNNQVSVIRITDSLGYLASVENTSLAGAASGTSTVGTVTSQLTPGTVITGLTLYLLPKIYGEKVYLQVNADISTLIGLDSRSSGSQSDTNNSTIQTPHTTSKSFNQRSMIKSGDTLILAGFRQVSNKTGAMQFLTAQALGGKAAQQLNKETIILITPIILHGSV